ncbi:MULTISPECIES: L,D-transpeptidase family protein [Halomonadaceae]|uniref:L,D-transpeptidase family protein n=1 Tax=Halomonadaceae TaxID=28256 RepID=UPI001583A446|nr:MULTISPECIES: L,D-transpeptidase family protein [Halomonas]MDI4636865.1 L,D-transpeptidase family protein [Halomonas sp. BMC7]NUJ58033.1 L,D-transpeptidase family protein [Halomonas taeanensis]
MGNVIDKPGRRLPQWVLGACLLVFGLSCAASGIWAQAEAVSTETIPAETVLLHTRVSETLPFAAIPSEARAGQAATVEEAGSESPAEVPVEVDEPPTLEVASGSSMAPIALATPFETYLRAASQTLSHGSDLLSFYEAFGFRQAWADEGRVEALASALEGLDADGLVIADYSTAALLTAYRQSLAMTSHGQSANEVDRWRFELAATQRLVLALRHLYLGKVDPVRTDAQWEIPLPDFAPDWAAIASAVANGDPAAALEQVRPHQVAYRQLRQGLARYRTLQAAGGWAPLASFSGVLRPGDHALEVIALRRRLAALGELELLMPDLTPRATAADLGGTQVAIPEPGLASGSSADQVYDARLVAAVERFQHEHLLEVDGVVGPRTWAALSVSVAERVDQIRLNLERLRWLSHALPERYVLVDIAGYEVSYVRPGQPTWRSRVVVGRPYRRTPTLRSAITHMTFHPTWTVPPTILREDVLPAVRRDPFYLMRHDMRVLDRQGWPLDPWQVDWWQPGPIKIQQRAGPSNPLGDVVIRFPNRHLVYLHDTPSRSLFERAQRSFSSGCIRVEGVLELVQLLFEDDRVTPDEPDGAARLSHALQQAGTHNVRLRVPVPVLLFYSTVQPAADGRLIFRPDVYERDATVLAALVEKGGKNLFDGL